RAACGPLAPPTPGGSTACPLTPTRAAEVAGLVFLDPGHEDYTTKLPNTAPTNRTGSAYPRADPTRRRIDGPALCASQDARLPTRLRKSTCRPEGVPPRTGGRAIATRPFRQGQPRRWPRSGGGESWRQFTTAAAGW